MRMKQTVAMALSAAMALTLCLTGLPRSARAKEEALGFCFNGTNANDTFVEVVGTSTGWEAVLFQGVVARDVKGRAAGTMSDSLKLYSNGGRASNNYIHIKTGVGTASAPLLLTVDNLVCIAHNDTSQISALQLEAGSHVKLTVLHDSFFITDHGDPAQACPAINVSPTASLTITGGTITAHGNAGQPAISGDVTIAPGTAKTLEARASDSADGLNNAASVRATVVNPHTDVFSSSLQYAKIQEVSLTVSANPAGSVAVNTPVTLTAAPRNITSPSYQWYSSAAASATGGIPITGGTNAAYAPPTTTAGTFHYYCTANGTVSNVVTVTVTSGPIGNLTIPATGDNSMPGLWLGLLLLAGLGLGAGVVIRRKRQHG